MVSSLPEELLQIRRLSRLCPFFDAEDCHRGSFRGASFGDAGAFSQFDLKNDPQCPPRLLRVRGPRLGPDRGRLQVRTNPPDGRIPSEKSTHEFVVRASHLPDWDRSVGTESKFGPFVLYCSGRRCRFLSFGRKGKKNHPHGVNRRLHPDQRNDTHRTAPS